MEMRHPLDMELSASLSSKQFALQLCKSRIIDRGEDHPSFKTSQHNWQSNLASAANGFEFLSAEEISVFHSHICVDLTMSPHAVASYVLPRSSEVGLFRQTDVGVQMDTIFSNLNVPCWLKVLALAAPVFTNVFSLL